MRTASRPLPSSRRHNSPPRRPDGSQDENLQRVNHGIPHERRRKRSRSWSHDRAGTLHSLNPSVDEPRDRSGSRTSSPEPSPLFPRPQASKGKAKAVDLGTVANDLAPSTSGSEAERVTIDNAVVDARINGFPNAEHTVIGHSKRGNRDRTPKLLTLRQSVQAHLSLPKTEPVKVSGPPDELKNRSSGPVLRHGRPSLLERISGMEEIPNDKPVSVSAAHLDISTRPRPPHPLSPPVAMRPQLTPGTISNIDLAKEGTTDIDNHPPDHISNISHNTGVTAHADRSDRAPRVDTDNERTQGRPVKIESVVVTGIPSTSPFSPVPPIPLVPWTLAESKETNPFAPVVMNLRSKLLERLDGERKRAIGAASGESQVEPDVGNISEDTLRAELRARSRLRARLTPGRILEP